MPNVRLIKEDDMDLLRSMFDFNPISNGIRLTEAQIATWCDDTMTGIKDGLKQVAVNFDDTGSPIAMSAGVEKPLINGWIQNLTLVRHPADCPGFHSAKIIAPAMELLLDHMESKRYYKFWDISKVKILGLAKSLISRHTDKFDRYDYFDEMIIPAGQLSGVRIWDINRRIHPTMDMTVRLYVLRQEYRLPLL